jgi:hypothetical protein
MKVVEQQLWICAECQERRWGPPRRRSAVRCPVCRWEMADAPAWRRVLEEDDAP